MTDRRSGDEATTPHGIPRVDLDALAERTPRGGTDGASSPDRRGLIERVESRRTIGETRAPSGPTAARREPALPGGAAAPTIGDPTPADLVSPTARRVWRRVLQVGAVLFALLVGYYLVSLYQVWSTGRQDHTAPVDAIVVMGAAQYDGRPSPQLSARLDHVVEIWPEGRAPLVVVTGGNQPGDRFTEAEASATYLLDAGIPEDVLRFENRGSTTYESLAGVAELLRAEGAESVLIVTDPYHALRSKLIAEEVGLDAHVSSTDTSVVTGTRSFRRHLQEAAGVSLGRIIGFERLSDLTG